MRRTFRRLGSGHATFARDISSNAADCRLTNGISGLLSLMDGALPTILIEQEMHATVRKMSGIVVADLLGKTPSLPQNADYAFRDDNVIVELKCLEEDTRSSASFKNRVNALHEEWVRAGKVPRVWGTVRVNSDTLPMDCQKQLLDILKRRLERIIDKASRQIVATRKALDMSDALGLLLLANDGDSVFTPQMFDHCLHRILNNRYSAINSVTLFSANQYVNMPGVPVPSRIWADLVINDSPNPDRQPVSILLRRRIQKAWFNHLATVTGQPTITFDRTGRSFDGLAWV